MVLLLRFYFIKIYHNEIIKPWSYYSHGLISGVVVSSFFNIFILFTVVVPEAGMYKIRTAQLATVSRTWKHRGFIYVL